MPAINADYLDATCYPGTTFQWNYQMVPLDNTGGTASFTVVGIVPGGVPPTEAFSVACSQASAGAVPVAQFYVQIDATVTVNWLPGTYDYQMLVNYADGTSEIVVTGTLIVKKMVGIMTSSYGFLPYVGPITAPGSLLANRASYFNTYGLSATLVLRSPDISTPGMLFATGDIGRQVETNQATLTDINGYQFENPIDGLLYSTLTWGPGSGGGVANPNLPVGGKYTWILVQVAELAGPVTYWAITT